MNSGQNESFVANRVDTETKWILKTLSDAEPTANVEETLSLFKQLFRAFDKFAYPTNLGYVLWVPESGSDEYVPITGSLESSSGISVDELATEFHSYSDDGIGTFRRLTIENNITRIDLNDGEHLITVDSDRYRTWTGDEIIDQSPAGDVFQIDIFYDSGSADKPSYYEIVVWTHTDIWFENSEIGERNRNRLATALNQLYDVIDAKNVDFESRLISKQMLLRKGFSDLLPSKMSE